MITELEKSRMKIEADLKMAERIHRSMIPRNERRGNLEVECNFTPMIGIGGDYASVHFQDDTHVVVTICDVSGHGIASALLASRVNSFVLNMAHSVNHPCQIIDALNEFIFDYFGETGMYLTFFCLFLNLESNSLIYSGCGHPPVLFYSKKRDEIVRLDSENTILGIFEDLGQTCAMLKLPFESGDCLIMYTDGITEARNENDEFLGIERLETFFKGSAHLPTTRACVDSIIEKVDSFRNGRAADDDQLLLALSFL